MTTDRELLELAARAAGIELAWSEMAEQSPRNKDGWHTWNPLLDDGDALRLAVKLKLSIDRNECHCCVTVWTRPIEEMPVDEEPVMERFEALSFGDEPGAQIQTEDSATRRAIVRAAASLGSGITLEG